MKFVDFIKIFDKIQKFVTTFKYFSHSFAYFISFKETFFSHFLCAGDNWPNTWASASREISIKESKRSSNKNYAKDNTVKSGCESVFGRFYT